MTTDTEDDYSDLFPGAVVEHPKYGMGVVQDEPWEYGQPLVRFDDGRVMFCNPDRLSTDDD